MGTQILSAPSTLHGNPDRFSSSPPTLHGNPDSFNSSILFMGTQILSAPPTLHGHPDRLLYSSWNPDRFGSSFTLNGNPEPRQFQRLLFFMVNQIGSDPPSFLYKGTHIGSAPPPNSTWEPIQVQLLLLLFIGTHIGSAPPTTLYRNPYRCSSSYYSSWEPKQFQLLLLFKRTHIGSAPSPLLFMGTVIGAVPPPLLFKGTHIGSASLPTLHENRDRFIYSYFTL